MAPRGTVWIMAALALSVTAADARADEKVSRESRRITTESSQAEVTGQIVSISASSSPMTLLIRGDNGRNQILAIESDTKISRNGQTIAPTQLKVGQAVRVERSTRDGREIAQMVDVLDDGNSLAQAAAANRQVEAQARVDTRRDQVSRMDDARLQIDTDRRVTTRTTLSQADPAARLDWNSAAVEDYGRIIPHGTSRPASAEITGPSLPGGEVRAALPPSSVAVGDDALGEAERLTYQRTERISRFQAY